MIEMIYVSRLRMKMQLREYEENHFEPGSAVRFVPWTGPFVTVPGREKGQASAPFRDLLHRARSGGAGKASDVDQACP